MRHDDEAFEDRHEAVRERLSDFLDGELAADEHTGVDEHLAACGSCRSLLADLRAIRDGAGALGPVEPPEDLWDGIAATIGAPVPRSTSKASADDKIIALPTATTGPEEDASGDPTTTGAPGERPGHGLSLSGWQLLAASIVLVIGTSLVTWSLDTNGSAARATATSADEGAQGIVAPATLLPPPPADLVDELERLEAAVVERRGTLDPNTVRILERNLGVIEQAIDDSRRALAQDPGNDFLSEHLERVYERKLEYLRDAARIADRAG